MAPAPGTRGSFDRPPPPAPRAGIFGLETEYAVLWLPERSGGSEATKPPPPFAIQQDVIFSILREELKTALSSGVKGGYFLQNGGMAHLEIFLRHQGDTPILELATPECRRPRDLLVYSRAFDDLLRTISARSGPLLAELGYQGRIGFGKSNLDRRGTGFGCHENYLVHLACTRVEKVLYGLALPLVLLALLPALFVAILLLPLIALWVVGARSSPVFRAASSRLRDGLLRHPLLRDELRAAGSIASSLLLFPSVWIYRSTLRLGALRPFVRYLTPHLVTRQVLTGAGWLDFRRGVFQLSQRAELTRSVSSVVMFGKNKTIFDLKSLLYDPLSLLKPAKRLTVTSGDSLLSDVPLYLQVASTALILEMIEGGESFEDLRLRRPLRAFRTVSNEGPWKTLRPVHGGSRTALELQREYFARARRFFASRADDPEVHRALELWGSCLRRLGDRPGSLATRLDWTAKKSLLDQIVLASTPWTTFFAWGRVFRAAGLRATESALDLDDLVRRAPWHRRALSRRLWRRARLDPAEFSLQRNLHLRARKIDLRYHELSDTGGYQRELETGGLIERITTDEEVGRASREPPADTRARIRGYYIQLSPAPESIHAGWNEIEILSPLRHISLPDPFYHRLPGDS